MARKNIMVTRTVKSSVCTTLLVNPDKTTVQKEVTIAGEFDAQGALTYLQKNPAIVAPAFPAYVFAVRTEEELYGMTLECFLKHSIKLPPRTGKTDENEEVETLEEEEA